MNKKVTGKARGHMQDAAEAWLKNNDPNYAEQKKSWQTPATDALVRERGPHESMRDLTPINFSEKDGNYRRAPKSGERSGFSFDGVNSYEEDFEDEGEQ